DPDSLCGAMGEQNTAPETERSPYTSPNTGDPAETQRIVDKLNEQIQRDEQKPQGKPQKAAPRPEAGQRKELPKDAARQLNALPKGSRVGKWEKIDEG